MTEAKSETKAATESETEIADEHLSEYVTRSLQCDMCSEQFENKHHELCMEDPTKCHTCGSIACPKCQEKYGFRDICVSCCVSDESADARCHCYSGTGGPRHYIHCGTCADKFQSEHPPRAPNDPYLTQIEAWNIWNDQVARWRAKFPDSKVVENFVWRYGASDKKKE